MTPAEQTASELRDLSDRLRRVPGHCVRDGIALVEWLKDEARIARKAAERIASEPSFRRPVRADTVFRPGRIQVDGRDVRVETRARRRVA